MLYMTGASRILYLGSLCSFGSREHVCIFAYSLGSRATTSQKYQDHLKSISEAGGSETARSPNRESSSEVK